MLIEIIQIILVVWLIVFMASILTIVYLYVRDYFEDKKSKGGKK